MLTMYGLVPESKSSKQQGADVTENVRDNVGESVRDIVTEKELVLLEEILRKPTSTTSELASKLGLTERTIHRRFKALKEKGILVRVGSDIKGYWEIVMR